MNDWIVCTNANNDRVYVNRDAAVSLSRRAGSDTTNVNFGGGENSYVQIKETPEQFLKAEKLS